ncbi:hypothetical protein ASPZODRAFT_152807 [Penicilliopsis zonata CBS 506.65]|uniref:Pre-mRNA-splicing factor 18 n=1 Tax=Penicilliopsis zonata CBS 506.65 TaxID=1073090 RepID=A0A1L9SFE2_9EURO|nr:hypothetical protein ASPZODRAFT_152807 [Penicilliopsis zonata CBS 506.65]OJJ45823.1 hypothetical protein ASPZODRAFT_152807 [Penicilliopsis zonata CBS 506.65]
MDFASLMAKEISKAKPAPASQTSDKKYLRRGEVEAARVATYNEEQERLQREREDKQAQKRKREDEEHERRREREEKKTRLAEESRRRREEEEAAEERERRKRLGLPELPAKDASKDSEKEGTPLDDSEADMDDEELVQKLREMNQPARLFGETHRGRLRRYRRLLAPEQKLSAGPIATTLELVPEKEMKVNPGLPKDEEARRFLYRQLASYFSMVLAEWKAMLDRRDLDVRESFQGRQAYAAMVQSRENMKPLFRKLEKGELSDGILKPVVEIVHKAQLRRYVDANDAYLRLSIGKAAWPIGVTMVGIHERSAREKLHAADHQAHILSDESTRKYLQSIKRCLSFAQVRWPPDDQLQLMG